MLKINIPTQKNSKLAKVVQACEQSAKLEALLRACNIMAMDRMGYSDHGPTHARIAANIALKLLRMLEEAGVKPDLVSRYKMGQDDAEVVVFLGTILHDVGHTVHREGHEDFGIPIALELLPTLLQAAGYDEIQNQAIKTEALHCIASHEKRQAYSIEAGCAKVGDALNITEGRSSIPFQAGTVNIHSVSAQAIKSVELTQQKQGGGKKPILVEITMTNSAGIFQVDTLLKEKLGTSGIRQYVQIIARVVGETEKKIVKEYEL